MRLYKALIRPRLGYVNVIWYPLAEKDINTIESIQRRATKLIPELKDRTYEELKLPTLIFRRMRGDTIESYKLEAKKYDLSQLTASNIQVYKREQIQSRESEK